jgi:hypothetical protein
LSNRTRRQADETSHLLVALRPQPTLAHFDPETIDYWTSDGSADTLPKLDREARFPLTSDYAWGRVTITDRLNVKNEFLSFGGALRAQMAPDATVLAGLQLARADPALERPQPGLGSAGRRGGRLLRPDQGPDRLRPRRRGARLQGGPAGPLLRLHPGVRERLTQAQALREANRWLAEWSSRESQRMESVAGDQWRAATELRRQLAAIEAIARE